MVFLLKLFLYFLAIIVTGGGPEGSFRSVEAFNADLTPLCALADLPDNRIAHTMEGDMLCGGSGATNKATWTSCINYDKGQWKTHEWSLLHRRSAHIHWKTDSNEHLLLGGFGTSRNTSEIVTITGSQIGFDFKHDTWYII